MPYNHQMNWFNVGQNFQITCNMQLYIDTPRTSISVRNNAFNVSNAIISRIIAPKKISSIGITSNATINASAIKLAATNEIPIYYYNQTGGLIAILQGPSYLKHSALRLQQLSFMNAQTGLKWALDQLNIKTELQLQTLTRLEKENYLIRNELVEIIENIKIHQKTLVASIITHPKISNTLMGLEGVMARYYFKGINLALPKIYQFNKRSRQPAEDYFNAALNYLYGITYSYITKSLQAAGLDTFVGALHKTTFQETLVFDAIEPFRPIIDRLLLSICLKNELTPLHFKQITNGFWLSKEGKKVIIPAFADYLQTKIKLESNVTSIQNHMYLQARKLKLTIQNTESNVPAIL